MDDLDVAIVAHEANRAYCHVIGDNSQVPWLKAPDWQRQSAVDGVKNIRGGKVTRPSQSHESWLAEKERTGWTFGPVKDAEKKEHPCFVPYDQLPEEQKKKDALFFNVVVALTLPSMTYVER